MKKHLLYLFFIVIFTFAQEDARTSLNDKLLIGGDFGFTFTSSDYQDVGVGVIIRGVVEYYFFENEVHKIGVRGFTGYGFSTGSDNRFNPDGFKTDLFMLSAGGVYSLNLSEFVSPYAFLGLKYLHFNPKDSDGKTLPNNAANQYDLNIFNFAFELGLRYKFSDKFYGYSSLVSINLTNDNIDDIASGSSRDMVFSLNLGLLYALEVPWSDSKIESLNKTTLPDGIDRTNIEIPIKAEDENGIQSEPDLMPANAENEENLEVEQEVTDDLIDEGNADEKIANPETESNIVEELSHQLDFGRVFFEFGKTEFGRMEYVELDRLYSIIAESDKSRWKISAYTDNKEPVQVHQSLGIQRAYFVLRYFMSKGLDRDLFEIEVMGEENPIADNNTEAGRAKNRRVEISRIK